MKLYRAFILIALVTLVLMSSLFIYDVLNYNAIDHYSGYVDGYISNNSSPHAHEITLTITNRHYTKQVTFWADDTFLDMSYSSNKEYYVEDMAIDSTGRLLGVEYSSGGYFRGSIERSTNK